MKALFLCLLMILIVGLSGCVSDTDETTGEETDVNTSTAESEVNLSQVEIVSDGQTYPAYVAAPTTEGEKPAVVLIHSFNGMEPGYVDLTEDLASEGYVVISPEWQTFEQSPADATVQQLILDSVDYLGTRSDVDTERLGLTGFCAGGRYTMLFLPQMQEFASGVAWYGFPYSGGTEAQPEQPAELIDQLEAPILIIHGTSDEASSISDIYAYATELDAEDKYFEMKIYQGQPHGFMIEDGELSDSFEAQDAYWQMVTFFDRTLKQ
ncbi:dienelactone hydrolase family protein [Methanolobus zinderi]|jgi:carboxymethylenebutenolidase|uniref:Dienelactone hydrolase family protein n=1 Tax=Methanolobus zinderi TaxID=536044 RepID=A0A7D5E7U5_9EURY|nr:dienelactone hydrolase family protein [Methanolobus zinderi]QLC49898.1 dienelactone hydrolase family protein [Methanolobus zinderi]